MSGLIDCRPDWMKEPDPERIWAWMIGEHIGHCTTDFEFRDGDTEYVRSDLIQQARAEAYAEALADTWSRLAGMAVPIKGTPYSCGPNKWCAAIKALPNPYEVKE